MKNIFCIQCLLSLLLTSCMGAAPSGPVFRGSTPTVKGPEKDPEPDDELYGPSFPNATDLIRQPVNSGFVLYKRYCEDCHDAIDVTEKRGRIVSPSYITDSFLYNAGYHVPGREKYGWPSPQEGALLHKVLNEKMEELNLEAQAERKRALSDLQESKN